MRAIALWTLLSVGWINNSAVAQLQVNPASHADLESAGPAWKAILAAQTEGSTSSDKRQFVFRCVISKQQNKLAQSLSKNKPEKKEIIAIDKQPAKIASVSQRPFVTGVQFVGKSGQGDAAYQPLLTALDEGSSVELTIKSLDEQHVQVDAEFSFTELADVDEVAVGERNTQAVTHRTVSQRLVRSVRLGESAEMTIPGLGSGKPTVVKYTVTELAKR